MDETIRTIPKSDPVEDFYTDLDPQTVSQAKEFENVMIAELSKEDKDEDRETLEIAYLNVIDKCAQLSKTFHPLSEMGKDRLWNALNITEQYEKTIARL